MRISCAFVLDQAKALLLVNKLTPFFHKLPSKTKKIIRVLINMHVSKYDARREGGYIIANRLKEQFFLQNLKTTPEIAFCFL